MSACEIPRHLARTEWRAVAVARAQLRRSHVPEHLAKGEEICDHVLGGILPPRVDVCDFR
jgi:hypothetical protein